MQETRIAQVQKFASLIVMALVVWAMLGSTLSAQSGNAARGDQTSNRPTFGKPAAAEQQPWRFEGRLHLQQGSTEGYIVLQVDLAPEHYIYSVSPEGSPAPTKIEIVPAANIKTPNTFSPDQPPAVVENDPVFQRRIEKHTGRVQFFVPCKLDPNADYKLTGMPVIEFNGQVCSKDGVCIPIRKKKIQVNFAGYFEQEAGQTSSTSQTQSAVPAQANAAGIPLNPTR
jgi:thiol:disulfide interchange protein